MGEEQTNRVEPADATTVALVAVQEAPKEVSEKVADAKDVTDSHGDEKRNEETKPAKDKDVALARVETEKKWALIKAWEENEKAKADNKAYKKLSTIEAWENTRKAKIEAELKQIEEDFEKKKAKWGEKMKNKKGEIHKEAEEKKAAIEAKRGEEIVKVDEAASKFRATGTLPKKLFGCFST